MLPNTLGSFVVFVFLLLPGYTFVRRRQQDLPTRDVSALIEIAAVIFAGVFIDAVVLAGYLGLRAVLPAIPPDVDQFVREPGTYSAQHYTELALTAVVLLIVATLLAYVASARVVRRAHRALIGSPPDGHQSAWWLLFSEQHKTTEKFVSCVLDDGSLIRGTLFSFSRATREHPDREIVLTEPLEYRGPGDTESVALPGVAAVSVSSRRITLLMVSYIEPARAAPGPTPALGDRTDIAAGPDRTPDTKDTPATDDQRAAMSRSVRTLREGLVQQ